MPETPDHRTGFATRSGDTHVIGADGAIVNTDQQARDQALMAAAAAPVRDAAGKPLDPPAGDPADPPADLPAGKRPRIDAAKAE